MFGSFANVLIYRLPLRLSIVKPASFCPACNHKLGFWEKIPIFSYVFLQGRCFHCDTRIDIRYLNVELLVSLCSIPFIYKLVFVPIRAFVEVGMLLPECLKSIFSFLFILVFLVIAIAVAVIDNDSARIPHSLSYSGIIFAIFFAKIFLTVPFIESFANLGLILVFFDAFNHFANKIIYKKFALPICPSALTLRFKFLEKYISFIYISLFTFMLILFFGAHFIGLKILLCYLGFAYFINEIVFDFYLFRFYSPKLIHEQEEENKIYDKNSEFFSSAEFKPSELKNAWGGGDTIMIAFIAMIGGIECSLLSVAVAFSALLIFRALTKDKSKTVRLGPALALAVFVAIILRV
ncbi:MAG: prepilin peptidase [Candidatus Melainabacteria bacterium]|nr:prepilin peptidase [Candidatus Melainabacteria bacterium]